VNIPSAIKTWAEVKEGDIVLADTRFAGKQLVVIKHIFADADGHLAYYEYGGTTRTFSVAAGELVAVVEDAPELP
jgi:hypothetical protein